MRDAVCPQAAARASAQAAGEAKPQRRSPPLAKYDATVTECTEAVDGGARFEVPGERDHIKS